MPGSPAVARPSPACPAPVPGPGVFERHIAALVDRGAIDAATAGRLAAVARASTPRTTPAADPLAPLREIRGELDAGRGGMHAPIVLFGVDPPETLAALHAAVRERDPAQGFRRRVLVVHEDESSLAAALATPHPAAAAADDAVLWFLGESAGDRLLAWLAERPDDALPRRLILAPSSDPSLRAAGERAAAGIARLREKQERALADLRAATDARLAGETLDIARARLTEAARGERRLCVLVCTTRHSTYTRFAADGLVVALAELGHRPTLLIEQDASTVSTQVAYARAVERDRPDLIVVINYTRSMMGSAISPRIPFVTWIQDAMPHLFDPRVGSAMTGFDLWAGATLPVLHESFGYRPEMAMPYPITACPRRFHDGPVDPRQAARFACDIALVSHHAEPPEALHARLRGSIGPGGVAVVDALWEEASAVVAAASQRSVSEAAHRLVPDVFARVTGRPPTVQETARLRHAVLEPLLGRIFRHRTIEAAARIADRRGWTLRLYGRGWDAPGPLARFAAGPVDHGEDLRACYRVARAHLHLDLNTLTHQRVFECVLSGGLPLMRASVDAFAPSAAHALDELVQLAVPARTDPDGTAWYRADAAPLSRRLRQERLDAGLPAEDIVRVDPVARRSIVGHPFYRERTGAPFDPVEVLGGCADLCFTDEHSLEQRLERAVLDLDWREGRAARARAGALRHAATTVFAERLIEHAARVLGWGEARAAAGLPARVTDRAEVAESYDRWLGSGRHARA